MSEDTTPTGASAGPTNGEVKAETPEVLAYLGFMAGELHAMAKRNGLTVIAALLNLARVEAELGADATRSRQRAN